MFDIGFENLGTIKKGTVELNNLTIFTGENNTGKTYASYSAYGILKNLNNMKLKLDISSKIIKEISDKSIAIINLYKIIDENYDRILQNIESQLTEDLSILFSADDQTQFNESKIIINAEKQVVIDGYFKNNFTMRIGLNDNVAIEFNKEENSEEMMVTIFDPNIPTRILNGFISQVIIRAMFSKEVGKAFLLPAERTGLNLFFKELNINRNTLIDNLNKITSNKSVNMLEILENMTSRYPEPISDYIYFLNDIEFLKKTDSEYKDFAKDIQKTILNGNYRIKNNEIYFKPYRSNGALVSMHLASSTVKTFFGLVFYLEHMAKKGDYLIIDEPELNLHPDNQRNIAKVIAKIVNKGIKVIISTHSDHLVKEFNNLIMLNMNFDGRSQLMSRYGYSSDEILDPQNVSAYMFEKKTISKLPIYKDEGIQVISFDRVINNYNNVNDEIYTTLRGEESWE